MKHVRDRRSSRWSSSSSSRIWRLDGDVERRDRLVGDDQLRAERERGRDADALAQAAAQLVRVAARVAPRRARPAPSARATVAGAPAGVPTPWMSSGSRMMSLDALARVERGVRVLEDDLDLAAAAGTSSARRDARVTSSPSKRIWPARRLEQAEHEPAERRLAGARLADERRASRRRRPRTRRRRRRARPAAAAPRARASTAAAERESA